MNMTYRDDDLLGATLKMGLGLLRGGEDTSGLDDVVSADGAPWDGGGVLLSEDGDGLAVNDELAVDSGDVTLEAAVDGVVLEHVDLDRAQTR